MASLVRYTAKMEFHGTPVPHQVLYHNLPETPIILRALPLPDHRFNPLNISLRAAPLQQSLTMQSQRHQLYLRISQQMQYPNRKWLVIPHSWLSGANSDAPNALKAAALRQYSST